MRLRQEGPGSRSVTDVAVLKLGTPAISQGVFYAASRGRKRLANEEKLPVIAKQNQTAAQHASVRHLFPAVEEI